MYFCCTMVPVHLLCIPRKSCEWKTQILKGFCFCVSTNVWLERRCHRLSATIWVSQHNLELKVHFFWELGTFAAHHMISLLFRSILFVLYFFLCSFILSSFLSLVLFYLNWFYSCFYCLLFLDVILMLFSSCVKASVFEMCCINEAASPCLALFPPIFISN